MAMSGTITGARTGAYGPRIIIEWKVLEQDIAGNRSKVEAISYMDVAATISYTSRNSVNITIDGSRTTKTAKSSSSGAWKRELNRHTAWVNHSSDGSRSITIASSYDVQITWRGQWIGNISAGATVTLDSIPRASTINSASIPYYLQAPNGVASANAISISLSKKLSSYTHYIKLEHGNTFIGEWNESNPTSLELNTTHVTRIFNAVPNSTSGTFKLTVITKSGSSTIGSDSTNITANLHSNSGPYFTSNTIGIAGSGLDKTWNTYIQSVSKASVASSASPGLGATLRSISITQGSSVVGSSTGANVSATSPTLTASGNVSFKFTVTDSRGNTTEETKTINVLPYVTPSVNTFSAQRNATTSTTANISYNVSYSPVNGNNKLTIVSKYIGTASGTPVNKVFAGTGTARATDSSSYSVTNLNKFGNFDFSIEITDSLGNKSSNVYSMTSSALPLTLDRNNQGIGVGKDYERGALDVGGDAYIDGRLYVNNKEVQSTAGSNSLGDLNTINNVTNGVTFQHISAGATNTPGAWGFLFDMMGGTTHNAQIYLERDGLQRLFTRARTNGTWKGWNKVAYDSDVMPTSGSNDNGEWVRFPDGTQIAWKENQRIDTYVSGRVLTGVWTLPVTFTSIRPTCFLEKDAYSGSNAVNKATTGSLVEPNSAGNYTTANIYIYFGDDAPANKNYGTGVRAMVIGRWK
ncbi:hypothetical protein AVP_91 [Aerococcus phage vB_AviM_AVP]|nr:hypothetical protein AVP_91 [Aerococcus phage vB_AviM_AVP]